MAPSSPEIFTESLEKLVRKFDADKHHYLSKDCSEAQARIDFITPFFKALGWDVENEAGLPHHERAYSYLKAVIGSTFVARRAGT